MKFAGEVRLPDVDHPGVPAMVIVDDTHIEIVLEGESLGRWSLYDVQARRLISKAFSLELAGEDVTFLAEEPVDFAYRGVERMAEAWARFKTMRAPQRLLAVRKSRSGTKVSRVEELRQAMEANLEAQRRPPSRVVHPEPQESPTSAPEPAPPPTRRPSARSTVPAAREGEDRPAGRRSSTQDDQPPRTERARLERLGEEAAARNAKRIDAFRMEMARLESEQAEAQRQEAEQLAEFHEEMERLKKAMRALKEAEVREEASKEDQANVRAQAKRIDAERRRLELLEEERKSAADSLREAVQAKRAELERREADRWLAHRRDMERLRLELEALEKREQVALDVDSAQAIQDPEPGEPDRGEPGPDEPDAIEAGDLVSDEPVAGETEVGVPDEPLRSTDDEGPSPTDLAGTELPEEPAVPSDGQQAMVDVPLPGEEIQDPAGGQKKSGFMGTVRAAFTRDAKEHEHDFVDAPAGMGLRRSICSECGFVSIGSVD